MKTLHGPLRLADPGSHAPPELSAAIHALRGRHGSPEQIQSLGARLSRELAIPVTVGTQLGLSQWAKWLLGALLSGALGWAAINHRATTEVPLPRAARATLIRAQPPPAPLPTQPPRAPATPPTVDAPLVAAPRFRAARPGVSAQDAPHTPNVERELLLLQRSQAALDHNARLALSVAETHARDYPRGVFEQEREILAIEALLKLRRAPEAVARARAFVQHHPESPHTPRVRALLDRSKYQELPTTKPPTDHSREQQLLGGPHDYE